MPVNPYPDFVDGHTNWPMYAIRKEKLRLLVALPKMPPAIRRYWVNWLARRNELLLWEWQEAQKQRASGMLVWYWNREAEKIRRLWTSLGVAPARIAAKVAEYRARGQASIL